MLIHNPTEKKKTDKTYIEKYVFGKYVVYASYDIVGGKESKYPHDVVVLGPKKFRMSVNGFNAVANACMLANLADANHLNE